MRKKSDTMRSVENKNESLMMKGKHILNGKKMETLEEMEKGQR